MYKQPVHGWVPIVEDPPLSSPQALTSQQLGIEPWHHLADIPTQPVDITETQSQLQEKVQASEQPAIHPVLAGISPVTRKLLWDCVCYPYHSVSTRIKRLGFSGRAFQNAKLEGCEKGLIIESSAGQTVYLIATKKTFEAFSEPLPYKRNVSIEHSFYVGLGCFLLEKDPQNKSVRSEVPIGKYGAASDIVTLAHNGIIEGWEVTLTTSNILSNVTKYANTSYAKITFLCRNWKLSEAVKAYCRQSGLDSELLARVEYTHFGALLRRQRELYQY